MANFFSMQGAGDAFSRAFNPAWDRQMSAMAASRARDEERQFAQKMADRAEAKKREGIKRNLEARNAAISQLLGQGIPPTRGPGDELYLESGTQMVPVDDPRVAFQKTAPPHATTIPGLEAQRIVGEHKMGLQAAERAAKAAHAKIVEQRKYDADTRKEAEIEKRKQAAIKAAQDRALANIERMGKLGMPVPGLMAARGGAPQPELPGGLTRESAMQAWESGKLSGQLLDDGERKRIAEVIIKESDGKTVPPGASQPLVDYAASLRVQAKDKLVSGYQKITGQPPAPGWTDNQIRYQTNIETEKKNAAGKLEDHRARNLMNDMNAYNKHVAGRSFLYLASPQVPITLPRSGRVVTALSPEELRKMSKGDANDQADYTFYLKADPNQDNWNRWGKYPPTSAIVGGNAQFLGPDQKDWFYKIINFRTVQRMIPGTGSIDDPYDPPDFERIVSLPTSGVGAIGMKAGAKDPDHAVHGRTYGLPDPTIPGTVFPTP
jgi:hypothetical protein